MSEEWKEIPGSDCFASSLGRVRLGLKETYGYNNSSGYKSYGLVIDGRRQTKRVHRLVMLAFHGPSPLDVNHKNGVKTDNRLENLEYCTKSENNRHAMRTGLNVPVYGTRNQFAKLTEAQVEDILLNMGHLSVTEIGKKFGVKNNLISYIRTGKAWRHVHKRIGNFNHESTLRELETWAKERGMSPGKLLFVMRTLATDLRKVLSRDILTASRLGESWEAFEAARDISKNAPFTEKGGG